MFLLLLLTGCLFGSTIAEDRPRFDLAKAQEYFDNFISTYKKTYDDRNDEKLQRFEVFKTNLKIINDLNALNESIHGITEFADLSGSEFQDLRGNCLGSTSPPDPRSCVAVTRITGVNAPATLDYRQKNAVTPVKNQGQCHSCWAFVSAGCLEGAYALKYGTLKSLSACQLMDCLPSSGQCTKKGNSMRNAFRDLLPTKGVMLDSEYPYVARDSPCKYKPEKAKVKLTGCSYFNFANEETLKEALVQHGPIGLGLDSSKIQHYVRGIVTPQICPTELPNHAVLLVGYGTEGKQNYWIIKNSWGTNWGESGYIRLARGQNVCGMHNTHASVAAIV